MIPKSLSLCFHGTRLRHDLNICRSAAYAALEKWEEAREDGARAANLRPTWSKAWSRLGAALMGLEDYTEAKEAYSKARELEPDDKAISNAWIKVPSR